MVKDSPLHRLYDELFTRLSAYAYGVLRDSALAEDAVQEAFCIAQSKIAELSASPNPEGWLMNVLKNVLFNMRKSEARRNAIIAPYSELCEDDGAAEDEHVELMYADILGREDYLLFSRVVLDKCTLREVAEEFGLSRETCKKRLQRIKKKLRKILRKM